MRSRKTVHSKYGKFIIHVDKEDKDLLSKAWHISFNKGRGVGYHRVRRSLTAQERIIFGKNDIFLHQEVWFKHHGYIPTDGMTLDHLNFNTLDNRKINLEPKHSSKNPRGKTRTKRKERPITGF